MHGNAKTDKHDSDADHLFECEKYRAVNGGVKTYQMAA